MKSSKTLVIGVGNKFRGDDAAGLLAAKQLKDISSLNIEIIENTGDGVALMNKWSGRCKVILIDAVSSGSPAGTIHKFSAPGNILPSEMFKFSTHLFSVPQAISLSASLGNLPEELIIFGIEGGSFEYGFPVTDKVTTAIDSVVSEISEMSNQLNS